jgi:hypothetical protein
MLELCPIISNNLVDIIEHGLFFFIQLLPKQRCMQ